MIKTGITSASYCGFSDYQSGFKKIREHGYDCIDYQEFASYANSPLYQMSEEEFSEYLTSVRLCAEENNLKIWQLHGTWPHVDDFSEEGREATVEYFKKCILGAFHLHCPHVVIHPCMFKGWGQGTKEEMFDMNVALLKKLLPCAEKYGVTVCMENMPFAKDSTFSTAAELKAVVRALNSPFIKICLDTGHLNVSKGDMYETICLFGDDLAVLHVHDDIYGQDRHLIPFQGEVDWDAFIQGLRKISFQGCISLETSISQKMPQPMREEMQKQLAKIARYFVDEIEKA